MKKTSPILLWAALGEALGVNRAQIDKAIAHNEKYRVGATRTTEKLPEKITLADIKPEAHAALIDEALRVHGSVKVAAEKLGVDEEIVEAYKHLARTEGIFCEPASAASVAGVIKLMKAGYFRGVRPADAGRKVRIVCVCTGHGLKDPDNARNFSEKPISIPASVDAVMEHVSVAKA